MECFFGILKKRFMILKNPRMLLNNSKKIRNVVICCCIHNILLLYDVCEDDCWKESIGDDDVEDAVDGVNDEDGLPRGANEVGSDEYTRHRSAS